MAHDLGAHTGRDAHGVMANHQTVVTHEACERCSKKPLARSIAIVSMLTGCWLAAGGQE